MVNIVLLVHDRPKLTMQTLHTLYDNTPVGTFNLTIVDDGSELTTDGLLGLWVRQHPDCALLRIHNSKGITGQARNLGVYWAETYWGRGDYLYLTDNDMYFTAGWLNRLTSTLDFFYPRKLRLLGGWNHPYLGKNSELCPDPLVFTHDAVTGASQMMRWEMWDKYGPLDAHAVGPGQSEDWKFCQDIIKDGGLVGSLQPHLVFNCGITNSLGDESPGADQMQAQLKQAKSQYPELTWE